MKREDVLAKIFEAEFCEPKDKVAKEAELEAAFMAACEQTARPMYVLKPALLKVYPQYRAQRLAKELPNMPFNLRTQ